MLCAREIAEKFLIVTDDAYIFMSLSFRIHVKIIFLYYITHNAGAWSNSEIEENWNGRKKSNF